MKKLFIYVLFISLILIFGCVEKTPIVLLAENAALKTDAELVLENEYSVKNIGWWTKADERISWDFDVKSKSDYTIIAYYSCDPQFPGSIVDIIINDEKNSFKVLNTGSWGNFTAVEVGKIKLKRGSYKCVIKASSIAVRFVCNLEKIELVSK